LQQAKKRSRRVVQPVDDVFPIFEATCPDPLARFAQEIGLLGGKIRDNEPAQKETLAQHREHVGTRHRPLRVVLRDEATDRYSRKIIEVRPHRLLNGAADVLKIDVDPLRAGTLELFGEVGRAVIDASIEAQLAGDEMALLGSTGDSDNAAALDLCDLPDDRADGAGGSCNDDSLSRFRLADFEKPHIRGHPGHSENAQGG